MSGELVSFQVRESGELVNFQCRELGELVVNCVAGEAGQQFTVSRVFRAGCHSVKVNAIRYVGSIAIKAIG